MIDFDDISALTVNGQNVSLADVLAYAKLGERLEAFTLAQEAELVRQAAAQRDLTVTDEELQAAADQFRATRELHDAERTTLWFQQNHLSFAEWEVWLESEILRRKLAEGLAAAQTEQYFAANRLNFETAELSQLMVKEEDVARELRLQITEEGADFHALARQYSTDDKTRPASGYAGAMARSKLAAVVEAAVFGASPGAVVGPFKLSGGWTLFKVEALQRALLDEATRAQVGTLIFAEWLAEAKRKAKTTWPLLDAALAENKE